MAKGVEAGSPTGALVFGTLSKLIEILLVIPCDQAPVKHIFSMVSKIHTKYRPTIQNNTVHALLTCKVNSKMCCPQMEVSNELAKEDRNCLLKQLFKRKNQCI